MNTPTKIRRTDTDSFGFYAQTLSAPSKLQTRSLMERLQLSSNSSSAVSATNDLFDIHDDMTSVPNLFEDFKDVKTTLRVKACHTD